MRKEGGRQFVPKWENMKALVIYDNKKLDFKNYHCNSSAYLNSFKGNGREPIFYGMSHTRLCALCMMCVILFVIALLYEVGICFHF